MTKIVIPDARTLLGQTREENQRLRAENEHLREQVRKAQERLRAYELDRQRIARSGE